MILWTQTFKNRNKNFLHYSRIRKISTKKLYFVNNVKESIKVVLDCFLFFYSLHLEFFDQVQNLHAFDSFISFILLQEVPYFIFYLQCHDSGENC